MTGARRTNARILIVCAFALAAVAAAAYWMEDALDQDSASSESVDGIQGEQAEAALREPDGSTSEEALESRLEPSQDELEDSPVRRPAGADGVSSLRVVDDEGEAIPGAVVQAVVEQVPEFEGFRSISGIGPLPEIGDAWRTDTLGRAELTGWRHPAANRSSALWVWAAGHVATTIDLDQVASQGGGVIELADAPLRQVRVSDEEGRPVEGAVVHQQLASPSIPAFLEQSRTDEEGRVLLAAVQGTVHVWAERDDLVTRRWIGKGPSDLELSLEAPYIVQGSVTAESDLDPGAQDWRLTISEVRGPVTRTLASTAVSLGEFDPIPVPRRDSGSYTVTLEGENIATDVVELHSQPGASEGRVTLTAKSGESFRARVSTASGEDIVGAVAKVSWGHEDGPAGSTLLDGDPTGRFESSRIPAGPVTAEFSAPGYYAEQRYDAFVPNVEDELWVGLRPSAPLEGRVLGPGGEPVDDFALFVWVQGKPVSLARHTVLGARDGEFLIEDAPNQAVFLLASGAELPRSRVVRVTPGTDEAVSLELRLDTARPMLAMVVDATTEAPIPNAEVVQYLTSPDGPIAPWGPTMRADRLGLFQLVAPSKFPVALEASADDYETRIDVAEPGSGASLPLRIRLRKTAKLTVQLRRDSRNEAPPAASADWLVWIEQGGVATEYQELGTDGLHVFEDVAPGLASVCVWRTDQLRKQVREVVVKEAGGLVELKTEGPRTVEVSLFEEQATPYLGRAFVVISHDVEGGVAWWEHAVEKGAPAYASGIEADHVLVRVYSEDHEPLARRWTRLEGAQSTVEVVLGGEVSTVRVLDVEARPVEGATVFLIPRNERERFHRDRTDAEGSVQILGRQEERFDAWVERPDGAVHGGIDVDFAGGQEVDIRLGDVAPLQLVCIDAGRPVPGVTVTILTAFGAPALERRSDDSGVALFERLGDGRYAVSVGGEGVWPAEEFVRATEGQRRLDLAVRRTGRLELTVTDGAGAAIPDAELELVFLETGEAARAWLESGRLEAPQSLRTGVDGQLVLDGIPHGAYEWTASTAALAGTGSLVVEPEAGSVVQVVLQPR